MSLYGCMCGWAHAQEGVRERGEAEQQRRRELSEKFSETIADITVRMEKQQQERLQMASENDLFSSSSFSSSFSSSSSSFTSSSFTSSSSSSSVTSPFHLCLNVIATHRYFL